MEDRKRIVQQSKKIMNQLEKKVINTGCKSSREKMLSIKCTIEAIEQYEQELKCLYNELSDIVLRNI